MGQEIPDIKKLIKESYDEDTLRFLNNEVFYPEKLFAPWGRKRRKPEEYIRAQLEDIKDNTKLMEEIIEFYMKFYENTKKEPHFILSKAIKLIQERKSNYFEALYERVSKVRKSKSAKGFENFHPRAAAISRVNNQRFLKKVVDEFPNDFNAKGETPEAIAVKRIEDKRFLGKVIGEKRDSHIVKYAIDRIKQL